jgi:RNA polymerase sigma-70 factor (ECF subfamily)
MPDGKPGAEKAFPRWVQMSDTATKGPDSRVFGESMEQRSDELLIDQFVRGDEDSFKELVERYKRDIVSYVFRLVGDAGWAEDLAQDVFLKVYLKARDFRAKARFSTWLYRIAHNRAVDFLKRKKHEPKLVLHGGPEGGGAEPIMPNRHEGPHETSMRNELEAKLLGIVSDMDEKYRTVFVLCAMQRLSYEDAADVTGLSVKTVSSRLCRARKVFRAQAGPYLDRPLW